MEQAVRVFAVNAAPPWPPPSRRDFVEGVNPPDAAALPPQPIQHPVQHSVTEATTGLLPQEVKRTNELK